MFETPKLDDSIVGWEELYAVIFVLMQEFYIIDFLLHLNTFKMIKFRLVRLNLLEIAIIEVTRIFQVSIPEHYNTASSVANRQEVSFFIVCHSSQNIWLVHVLYVPFTQAIDIHPTCGIRLFHLMIARDSTLTFMLTRLVDLTLCNLGDWRTSHVCVGNFFIHRNRYHPLRLVQLIHELERIMHLIWCTVWFCISLWFPVHFHYIFNSLINWLELKLWQIIPISSLSSTS